MGELFPGCPSRYRFLDGICTPRLLGPAPFFCLLDLILEFLGHASSGLFLGFWAYRNCIGFRPGVLSELSVLEFGSK